MHMTGRMSHLHRRTKGGVSAVSYLGARRRVPAHRRPLPNHHGVQSSFLFPLAPPLVPLVQINHTVGAATDALSRLERVSYKVALMSPPFPYRCRPLAQLRPVFGVHHVLPIGRAPVAATGAVTCEASPKLPCRCRFFAVHHFATRGAAQPDHAGKTEKTVENGGI